MIITRFAPSPTGHLHLGHAYSALFAYEAAQKAGGKFLLRIEDIDPIRCKPEFTASITEDLTWLGLAWEQPVRVQSQHPSDYQNAFSMLKKSGVVYPCFCTRREVADEAAQAGHAPHGMESAVYAGTCRHLSADQRAEKLALHQAANWRLDVTKAMQMTGPLAWHDRAKGNIVAQPELFGDVVIARKDALTSYHLSVTVDDFLQGVTLVTRGMDLFASSHIHRLLQALLGYVTPDYHHHKLILDPATGKRFAKRNQSVTLKTLKEGGMTALQLRKQLSL